MLYKSGVSILPNKPSKPCAHQGCPKLTRNRYCEAHAKQEARHYNKYARDPGTSKRYSGAWKKIRAAFLAAKPLCEMCRRDGRLTPATLVHHIRPLKESHDNSPENLMPLCSSCHSKLHAVQHDYF